MSEIDPSLVFGFLYLTLAPASVVANHDGSMTKGKQKLIM